MVESGKLQVSAAAAASFLRVMSSAHTHGVMGKIQNFPIRVVFLYHIRTHIGFIRNISTPISCAANAFCYLLKVLRDVGEKSTFCSLALPAFASACVCACLLRVCGELCQMEYDEVCSACAAAGYQ